MWKRCVLFGVVILAGCQPIDYSKVRVRPGWRPMPDQLCRPRLDGGLVEFPDQAYIPSFGRGGHLYADDGRYLGRVNGNRFNPDSINNPFGRYGNRFGLNSVNNPFGPYGNRFSSQYVPLGPLREVGR